MTLNSYVISDFEFHSIYLSEKLTFRDFFEKPIHFGDHDESSLYGKRLVMTEL